MADSYEFDCPQFVDFTQRYSDHEEDDDSWFEVDHEAVFYTPSQIESTENDVAINISDSTTPVIVSKTMTVIPPKTPVIKEEPKDVSKEVTPIISDSRSPLNNRSNVLIKEEPLNQNYNNILSKEEFDRKKRKNGVKPPARVPGKENANKIGPSRVVVIKPTQNDAKTSSNEKLAAPQKDNKQPEESKPIFAKPTLPQQKPHRRSLSAGNLTLSKSKEMRPLWNQNKKNSSENLSHRRSESVEKLHPRRSVSVDKKNPRRSVSVEKTNPRRSVSSEKLYHRRSVSTENVNSKQFPSERLYRSRTNSASSINSEKSDASGTSSTSSKSNGLPKIRAKLVPSAYRVPNGNTNSKQLSSADLEQQEIEKKKRNALEQKKLAEDSLKKSLHSKGYVPVTSKIKPTKPKGYEFKSDKRLRTRSADYAKSPALVFAHTLRKDKNIPNTKPPKNTVVQPFKLSENSKKTEHHEKFQTVAEQIRNFAKKTPERFRSHSRDNKSQRSYSPPRNTIPRTPNFQCQQRSRPVHILSSKEIEEKEIEEIQKYKFKAKEMNKKIFQTRTGIKEVVKKETTVIQPFDLPGSKIPSIKKEIKEEHHEFHARPLPTDILEGVVGVKPAEASKPTIPESPAFALKKRMQRFAELEPKQEIPVQKIKARPYVHSGIKFEPKLEHRVTVAEPFTFVDKIKEEQMKKELKIQKMIEEEMKAKEFSANPLPDFSQSGVPQKKATAVTKPAPFKHHIEERVEKRIEEKQHQLEEEMKLQEERMRFKAQSCEVVNKAPFMPQLDHKCTQEHAEFRLNTEARRAQRIQFEEQKRAREAELQAERLEKERIRKEEEDREVQRLRREAVHKANPIRCYKPVEHHDYNEPTVPITPKFATKHRVRNNDSIN